MKQLGVLDTAFINLEQANTPQHIGGLGIYDPASAPDNFVRFKQVIANFERRLQHQPLFRTRLVNVPGGLDRPYWIRDANFDVEFHLRHIALPHPGDWRQLCIQVARLHARPLDMNRPLWEAYVIEGLDNIPGLPRGAFAIYTKLHHALVDGAGGAGVLALLHDPEPTPASSTTPPPETHFAETPPSVTELLSRASVNGVRNGLDWLRGSVDTSRRLGRYAAGLAFGQIPLPEINGPRTRFNGPVGPHRVFDAASFPLEDFKRIKTFAGVKVNDVAIGIISGALRRYLGAHGEEPGESLTATLPLNLRDRRPATGDNNQVGSLFTSLHSDIEDPLERLAAISSSSSNAKAFGEQSPLVDVIKLPGAFSPALARPLTGLWSHYGLSRYVPVGVSTVISNVAGPPFPLFCAGARMVDYYGLGVLTPGVGLFHMVFSYDGKVTLSVLADRDILPDPEFYRSCLEDAFTDLAARAGAGSRGSPRGKRGLSVVR